MTEIASVLMDDLIALIKNDPEIRDRFRDALDLASAEAGPIIYTTKTLSSERGVTEETVRRSIRRGELKAERRGKAYVITREAVEDWAEPKRAKTKLTRPAPRRQRSARPFREALDAANRGE